MSTVDVFADPSSEYPPIAQLPSNVSVNIGARTAERTQSAQTEKARTAATEQTRTTEKSRTAETERAPRAQPQAKEAQ